MAGTTALALALALVLLALVLYRAITHSLSLFYCCATYGAMYPYHVVRALAALVVLIAVH